MGVWDQILVTWGLMFSGYLFFKFFKYLFGVDDEFI